MLSLFHILLGLFGLSFIVLIHELGHFFAARLCKIKVERLCLFLGTPWVSWHWGGTEFGIAWLPLGGYCKMKDEGLAVQDLSSPKKETKETETETEKKAEKQGEQGQQAGAELNAHIGSFQAASPLQKIFVASAGPAINIIFAFFVLFLFQTFGYPELRKSNKIVVADTDALQARGVQVAQSPSPAERAGLKSGDVILKIGQAEIESFQDLRLAVALHASETLPIEYQRAGKLQRGTITLAKNADGKGWFGVNPWQDLLLMQPLQGVQRAGQAAESLPVGTRLVSIDGESVANISELVRLLGSSSAQEFRVGFAAASEPASAASSEQSTVLDLSRAELTNLSFGRATWSQPESLFSAFGATFKKLSGLLAMQWQGLKQIVQGRLRLRDNIAGPIQISDQIGQVMAGSGVSFAVRWYNIWQFLSFISFMIALANLLPLAVLDGGQILLFSCEFLAGGRLPASWIRGYQFVGSVIVACLMVSVLALELWHYIA